MAIDKRLILVTGANGFVGSALVKELLNLNGNEVTVALRSEGAHVPKGVKRHIIGDISSRTDWSKALEKVDVVIHVAGRAHILDKSRRRRIDEFREVNTAGTVNLAKQAIDAGVKKLIFISSIGVNGNSNSSPFTERDRPDPQEAYAISKFEAEIELQRLSNEHNIEIVIIRPPLVYGPKAPGNFATLLQLVDKGIPLPLGTVHNRRSLIALENLVDFIIHCLSHPKAKNQIFVISDCEDISTTELLKKIAIAYGKRPYLLPISVTTMRFIARKLGKSAMANKLFGNLQVDCSKAQNLLDWKPVITMDEQLAKIAKIESK